MKNVRDIVSSDFKKEVLEAQVPVAVDFWAPWCGPCHMVAPVVEAVSQKMDGQVKFVKINTDENRKVAQDYQIMAIPSLVIFKDGVEVHRVVGYVPEEDLEVQLKNYISSS